MVDMRNRDKDVFAEPEGEKAAGMMDDQLGTDAAIEEAVVDASEADADSSEESADPEEEELATDEESIDISEDEPSTEDEESEESLFEGEDADTADVAWEESATEEELDEDEIGASEEHTELSEEPSEESSETSARKKSPTETRASAKRKPTPRHARPRGKEKPTRRLSLGQKLLVGIAVCVVIIVGGLFWMSGQTDAVMESIEEAASGVAPAEIYEDVALDERSAFAADGVLGYFAPVEGSGDGSSCIAANIKRDFSLILGERGMIFVTLDRVYTAPDGEVFVAPEIVTINLKQIEGAWIPVNISGAL